MNELCLGKIIDVGYAPTSSSPTQKTNVTLRRYIRTADISLGHNSTIYLSRSYFLNRLVKRVSGLTAYVMENVLSESFKIVPACIRASDSREQNRLSTPGQDYGIRSLTVNFPFFVKTVFIEWLTLFKMVN